MIWKAFISGCSGLRLTTEELEFFSEHRPVGLILFARNCQTKDQLKALIGQFREAVGSKQSFILIDQEGGRVARLKPPEWRAFPPAAIYGMLFQKDRMQASQAAGLAARLMSEELREVGINVNCAPVLDYAVPGAHQIIGDRAYGSDLETISMLGRSVAEGYLKAGVLPVIKHIPGHGRADTDSHESLPVIEANLDDLQSSDFKVFQNLNDMPLAMTAHVLIPSVDRIHPVSVSASIISNVIRDFIGFQGAIMSDDLSMGALEGNLGNRTRDVLSAGCDLALHCNGEIEEMRQVADASPQLAGHSLDRVNKAFSQIKPAEKFDRSLAEERLAEVMSLV